MWCAGELKAAALPEGVALAGDALPGGCASLEAPGMGPAVSFCWDEGETPCEEAPASAPASPGVCSQIHLAWAARPCASVYPSVKLGNNRIYLMV